MAGVHSRMSKTSPQQAARGEDKRDAPALIVVAIDFGTTFSGYAYSFLNDFRKDPLLVWANSKWHDEGDGTLKTPTSILFDKDKKFHSFGYTADKKFASLAENAEDEDDHEEDSAKNEEYKDWYYFRRFKMELYRQYIASGPAEPGRRRVI